MNILVFHNLTEIGRSRGNAIDYLFSFERYADQHNYVYHRVTLPIVEAIRQSTYDVVIFDSTSLGVVTFRPRSAFYRVKEQLAFVADLPAVKLAFPQDDYNHSDMLDEWISELKCDAVFTALFDHHRVLYPRSSRHADFFSALTGYVDDRRVEQHRLLAKPFRERTRLIVQRVTFYPPRGGRFSQIKGRTAEQVKRSAVARGLDGVDISTGENDVLMGDDWFELLGDAKFCLGAESGVSLWDRSGVIADCTEAYISAHRDATFEEVEAACFAGRDGQHVFSATSPRLFEAALMRCCQILVDGDYLSELKPYEHYIPLAADGSNLDEVFELMGDDESAERRAAATYSALIENPQYRYSTFVVGVMQYVARKAQLEPRATGGTDFEDLRRAHRRQLLTALSMRERATGFNGQALVKRVAALLAGQFPEPYLGPDRAPRLIADLVEDLSAAHQALSAANHRIRILDDEADALRQRYDVVRDQNQALFDQNQALGAKLAELEEQLAGAVEYRDLPPAQRDLIDCHVGVAERQGPRSADLSSPDETTLTPLRGIERISPGVTLRAATVKICSNGRRYLRPVAEFLFGGALLGDGMSKRITLAWCVIVALAAYPLGSLASGYLGPLVSEYLGYLGSLASGRLGSFVTAYLGEISSAAVSIAPGLAISFALALLTGLCVLPRRLSPLAAERPGAAITSTIAWVLASASIWATYNYFTGNSKPEDVWALRFTSVAQATLALSGLLLIPLFGGRRSPISATIVCLLLFLIAFPATASADTTGAVGYVAAALFLVVNLLTHRVLMARYHFDGYSLALYSLATLQWIGVALVGWILSLYVVGIADRVPIWLPIATALLQACLIIGLPIGLLAARGRMSLARVFYNQASVEDAAVSTAVVRGAANGKRTAWILSYTGVSNEPRVRRQADALISSGWHVVVCGFDGHSPRPEQWTYIRLPGTDRFSSRTSQLLRFLCGVGTLVAVYARPKALATAGALVSHWCTPNWLHIKVCLLQIVRREADLKPDLVIANDYYTGDVAYAICRTSGAKFVVDSHEYAVAQSSHDLHWVKWTQPVVRAVEAYYLARADLVTTVCAGIADLLNANHRLQRPALVIRSVPLPQPQPFRSARERIKVLYHGNIWHVRQLHTAIESMRLWRPEFDLVLRGESDPAYLAELRRMVARYGLERRVFFEPPVPFEEIIPEANKADIGYFSYANFSPQSEFVLPNKFFEYVMAGLALCVVDFAEMGKLTRRYGFGKLIPEHSPQAIAETINSFTRGEIDRLKRASIAATKDLNWDREKERLLMAYNGLFGVAATNSVCHGSAAEVVMEAAV